MTTAPSVVRQVVRYLGIIALVALIGTIWLIAKVIAQGSGKGTVDPGSIAVIIPVSSLAAAALGALGSILVSTRSGAEEPTAVQVMNTPDDAVAVEEVAPGE